MQKNFFFSLCTLKKFLLLFFLFFNFSCGYHSLDEFQEEGEGISRSLTAELKKIHTRSELMAASPKIEVFFEKMADLMLKAHEQREVLESDILHNPSDKIVSGKLLEELDRIYMIDGGCEIIDKCREKALKKLSSVKF